MNAPQLLLIPNLLLVALFLHFEIIDAFKDGIQYGAINNKRAKAASFPWGGIAYFSTRSMQCRGSIIRNDFILTAAHCIAEEDCTEIVLGNIQKGKYKDADVIKFKKAKKQTPHPKYAGNRFDKYDIGLIELPHCIKFSTNIQALLLPRSAGKDRLYTGQNTVVFVKEKRSSVYTNMRVLKEKKCNDAVKNIGKHKLLCASELKDDTTGCDGFTGGPLVLNGTSAVIGIAIDRKCPEDAPKTYIRVGAHLDWIQLTMKKTKKQMNKCWSAQNAEKVGRYKKRKISDGDEDDDDDAEESDGEADGEPGMPRRKHRRNGAQGGGNQQGLGSEDFGTGSSGGSDGGAEKNGAKRVGTVTYELVFLFLYVFLLG